ncbi:uncharacterized protein LOC124775876 [Schistocerca piceifrons]|uniref:uncharacterized protein LOC124775876 n=1 Tax=Schistocerca piceifrons TaxID=274613 RepID=UPI001F5E8950|nr:uncharacterized protein LOC124775876 [Schistocerca piceifrons]
MGPYTVLTKDEEDLLVHWVCTMAKVGFPITKLKLLDSVQHLIEQLKCKNPFVFNHPGKTWYSAFLKRHPNIGIRMSQNLTSSTAGVKPEAIRSWFEIDKYLTENTFRSILQSSTRVFNLDETAFFLNPKGNKVLALKGEKKVYQIPQEVAESVPKHWRIGKSKTGWMTGPLFFEFITNVFLPYLLEKKLPLPESLKIKVHQWRLEHLDQPVLKKIHFAPLLEQTLDEFIKPSVLQNGFRRTGLVPWNPEAVDYSKIPSVSDDVIITSHRTATSEKLNLRVGLESTSDVWGGNINDQSLVLLWREIKNDCHNSILSQSVDDTHNCVANQNEKVEEGNVHPDEKQNKEVIESKKQEDMKSLAGNNQNKERQETNVTDQCVTPKNSMKNSDFPQCASIGNINRKSGDPLIPSPFKRALFWLQNTEKQGKRRLREKLPSVVTSNQWQEYHHKKEQLKPKRKTKI